MIDLKDYHLTDNQAREILFFLSGYCADNLQFQKGLAAALYFIGPLQKREHNEHGAASQ